MPNYSNYECKLMTILESLSCGSLVLAVDKAYVDHQSKCGALIKSSRNIKKIEKTIKFLNINKKKQKKIRNRALLYAKKYLDINNLTKIYYKKYKGLYLSE